MVFQAPLPAVTVEPSPPAISQVRVAALSGAAAMARNKADAAITEDGDANGVFMRRRCWVF